MTDILMATAMIAGVGIFVGAFLGIASKVFAVKEDERVVAIREALPGANCGACGYSGCDACAAAIANGEAEVTACIVGQKPVADQIAEIMGTTAAEGVRKVAFVRCIGDCEKTTEKYHYSGQQRCAMVKVAPGGGPKSCSFGCEGFGDCVAACEYDAIHIIEGIARVDPERCVDCKKCMKACPKDLITEVPYGYTSHIACVNPEKGKVVMQNCKVGCISCQKCVRECPEKCISFNGFPVIDYEKCSNCGHCREICPRHCIV